MNAVDCRLFSRVHCGENASANVWHFRWPFAHFFFDSNMCFIWLFFLVVGVVNDMVIVSHSLLHSLFSVFFLLTFITATTLNITTLLTPGKKCVLLFAARLGLMLQFNCGLSDIVFSCLMRECYVCMCEITYRGMLLSQWLLMAIFRNIRREPVSVTTIQYQRQRWSWVMAYVKCVIDEP